jgi:hypothetical protein
MSKLGEIVEGWKNNLTPEALLDEKVLNASKERMSICNECEHISTKHKTVRPDVHCVNCGCTLSAKTKCLSCACPLNKWLAIETNKE